MGTICLSLAPILRCQSLNRIQSAVLFIPPALELIFSVTLVVAKRGKDRKYLLLAGEGVTYAFLALLDLITHVIPSVSNNLVVFKGLDITIGALSFVPLLLFTIFLFLFTTNEIAPVFPQRVRRIAVFTFAVFPLLVVIFNELASFLTLSYRVLQVGNRLVVAVGFTDDTIRSFMDGLVLVLFVIFQALNFSAVFLRLIKAFLNQRQIDTTAYGPDNEVHLFNGLGWIAAGIKLGAVEGLIGFAQGGFGEALTRRILRFLGRACLVIGVLKGVDTVEDFRIFSFRQEQPERRSALRALISNPRNSTFQQIGGYDFQPGTVIPTVMTRGAIKPAGSPIFANRELELDEDTKPAITVTNSLSPSRPLVTIRRGLNRAPTLELTRLSDLNMVSPFKKVFVKRDSSMRVSSPPPEKLRPHTMSRIPASYMPSHPFSVIVSPHPALLSNRPARHTMGATAPEYAHHRPRRSSVTLPNIARGSAVSATSDSLEVVHSLAVQFPGIPARITPNSRQSTIEDALKLMEAEDELYPVMGVKRTPSDRSERGSNEGGLVRRSSSVKRKPVPKRVDVIQKSNAAAMPLLSVITPPLQGDRPPGTTHHHSQPPPPPVSPRSPITRRYTSPETHIITDFDDNFRTEAKGGVDDSPRSRKRSRGPRIKSVGSAPRRRTPVPTQTFTRESAVAEWFDLANGGSVSGMGSETSTIMSMSDRSRGSVNSTEGEDSFLHYH